VPFSAAIFCAACSGLAQPFDFVPALSIAVVGASLVQGARLLPVLQEVRQGLCISGILCGRVGQFEPENESTPFNSRTWTNCT